jgi:acylphosphatase
MVGSFDDLKRIHIIVSGRVQGVLFRSRTQEVAEKLGLVGLVRNTIDGGVEIVAEGEKEKLDELIAWCNKGPLFARVENIKVDWQTPMGEFSSFEIKY